MLKTIAAFLIVIVSLCSLLYALDWKVLHELADNISLAQALKESKEDPVSLEKLYILGLVYLNSYMNKEAEEVFRKMLTIAPENIDAKWGTAELSRRKRQYDESEQILKEIIKSNPEFSPSYISLAYIKYIKMEYKESARLAIEVIKQGRSDVDLSNYTRAYLIFAGARGMIAHNGGPFVKMIYGPTIFPSLKKAEKLMPQLPAVYFGLGAFYLLAPSVAGGNIDKAEEYLKKAVELDPLFADAYVRLAQVYKVKGEDKTYQLYLDKALYIDPQNELAIDIKNQECNFICIDTDGSS